MWRTRVIGIEKRTFIEAFQRLRLLVSEAYCRMEAPLEGPKKYHVHAHERRSTCKL